MDEFKKLGMDEVVLRAVQDLKFEQPTLIQELSIPLIAEGKDVIGMSATGSGKTLAFAAGIIKNAEKGKGIQALVLTPTRELAEQVAKALRQFAKHKPLRITVIYGGVSINPQMDALEKADVVVGTPGRILDHLERKTIYLGNVKVLVLDEADRMLDMGFIDDVEHIIKKCSQNRQTMLFSATIPSDIAKLSHKYMKNPVKVSAEAQVDPSKLKQVYYNVQDNMKFSLLVHLLKKEHSGLVMVFCNSRENTDFVANNLSALGVPAQAIHGGFSQQKRSKVMEDFHGHKVYVMVCTDVAARGLDIPGVSHVYNYDLPNDSKQYIHRIGRTARAGHDGMAVSIVASRDYDNFSRVLWENRVKIPKLEVPQIDRVRIRVFDREREPMHGRFSSDRVGPRGFSRDRDSHSSPGRQFGRGRSDSASAGHFQRGHSGRGGNFGRRSSSGSGREGPNYNIGD